MGSEESKGRRYSRRMRYTLIIIWGLVILAGVVQNPQAILAEFARLPAALAVMAFWMMVTILITILVVDLVAKYIFKKSFREVITSGEIDMEKVVIALIVAVPIMMLVATR